MKTPYVNLSNVDMKIIDQKFNFIQYQEKNKNEIKKKQLVAKTKISDITKDSSKTSFFSYIDEAKKDHICILTMKDFLQKQELPVKTELCCFWCRNKFSSRPIGCPLSYKNNRLYKKYYSEITKNNYCLQENISEKQFEDSKLTNDENFFSLELEPSNYYLTDGIFCSFNCCLSFIMEKKSDPIYTQSEHLLKKMYSDLFPDFIVGLSPAPDWRLLQDYGGDLSIEDFRKNFYKIDYVNHHDFTSVFPISKPIGFIYEKKIKL